MRFHVVALPHTHTTSQYSSCAYTAKTINFCRMMSERGHTVMLYSGEQNEALCDEHIVVVSEGDRARHVGDNHFTSASFDFTLPFWRSANARTVVEISRRAGPRDFICLIGGLAQKQISDAFRGMISVEFGVGYGGTFSRFRVFESYAWMHMTYGAESRGNPHAANGNWWDAVIPGYLDPASFPFSRDKDDYYLFIGRLIDRKGYSIAAAVCRSLGKTLVVAGNGVPPDGTDYRGVVGPEERGRLMSRARAVFVPTIYIEPFGNVHAEAMACGTPVITTDWGVFGETVLQGITGFRCRTFEEFRQAARMSETLDPQRIRDHALERFALEVVGEQYERYFVRLSTLWNNDTHCALYFGLPMPTMDPIS